MLSLHGLLARFRFLLIVLSVLVGLAVVERVLEPLRGRDDLESAQWIWAPGEWRSPRPVAFLAARDFELGASSGPLRLAITADEEFVAYLNGKLVGRGRFDAGPLEAIDIGAVARQGRNRLVVEARSSRGAGGLRATLWQGARVIVATDPSWRVYRALEPGLLRGWLPLDGGVAAASWGAPPVGRWGKQTLVEGQLSRWSNEIRVATVVRGRSLAPRTPWFRDWPREAVTPALRGASVIDFGRPIDGYLSLRYVGEGDALLFVGLDRSPDPKALRPDHVVVRVPGASVWSDVQLRRVRYVLSIGDSRLVGAWIDAIDLPAGPPPMESPRGVLGVTPPALRSPVEDKLRREFEGFTRLAEGEEG